MPSLAKTQVERFVRLEVRRVHDRNIGRDVLVELTAVPCPVVLQQAAETLRCDVVGQDEEGAEQVVDNTDVPCGGVQLVRGVDGDDYVWSASRPTTSQQRYA